MPYIIKNGLTYTGNLMPITQVQYNALSEAEKNNGIAYFIVDSDAVLDASDVGLGEGNVEDLAGSVAMIETSPATAIHAVGDFILWNGQVYEVTASIAVGETLTVGTNITAKTVGGELSTLNNGLINLNNMTRIDNPYEIVNDNVVSFIESNDNYLLICGHVVYFSIRWNMRTATTGSTTAMKIKDIYSQYLPKNYNKDNGVIATGHETWTNATSGLVYFNSSWGIGLSGGFSANKGYIASGMYII